MKIISFGWTHPAIAAREKICTRRGWTDAYAERFRKGEIVRPYTKRASFGGTQIIDSETNELLLLRLIAKPSFEPMSAMPNFDYFKEGFHYLNNNRHLLPKSMPYDVSPAGFNIWRSDGSWMWVVRFEYV